MPGGNGAGAFHRAMSELQWCSKLLVGAVVCFALAVEVPRQRGAWLAWPEPPTMPQLAQQYQDAETICHLLLVMAAFVSILLTTHMMVWLPGGLPKPVPGAAADAPAPRLWLRLTFFLAAVFNAAGAALAGAIVVLELELYMSTVAMSPAVRAAVYAMYTLAGALFAFWFAAVVRDGMCVE